MATKLKHTAPQTQQERIDGAASRTLSLCELERLVCRHRELLLRRLRRGKEGTRRLAAKRRGVPSGARPKGEATATSAAAAEATTSHGNTEGWGSWNTKAAAEGRPATRHRHRRRRVTAAVHVHARGTHEAPAQASGVLADTTDTAAPPALIVDLDL
jgi:hypothetical protein